MRHLLTTLNLKVAVFLICYNVILPHLESLLGYLILFIMV